MDIKLLWLKDQATAAQQLYDMAYKAMKNAYAPFSNFNVGSALLAESGRIYTGVNVENSSYGATICAERTAFVKAVSEGERKFIAIAIANENEEAIPCGICRQFMFEFGGDIKIITSGTGNDIKIRRLDELLPIGFSL